MSTTAPVYTGNGFEKFIEHVGHDIKVVFTAGERVVADLPKFIKTATDGGQDIKHIVPLVQDVVAASMAFAKPAVAIGAAIGSAGTNFAADTAAVSTILGLVPTFQASLQTFFAAIKALAEEIGVDWKQLAADLSGV